MWNVVSQSIYYIPLSLYSEETLPIMGTSKKVRRNKRKRDNINRNINKKNTRKNKIKGECVPLLVWCPASTQVIFLVGILVYFLVNFPSQAIKQFDIKTLQTLAAFSWTFPIMLKAIHKFPHPAFPHRPLHWWHLEIGYLSGSIQVILTALNAPISVKHSNMAWVFCSTLSCVWFSVTFHSLCKSFSFYY